MNDHKLQELLEKVLHGTANDEERRIVEEWFQSESNKEAVWQSESPDEEEQLEYQMRKNLQDHMRLTSRRSTARIFSLPARIAAAAVVIAGITCAVFFLRPNSQETRNIQSSGGIAVNRYVMLPDSSIVVLRPGSHITYDYSGKTRALQLTGEAYFDVKHRADKPFVVTSGHITTTVLGTAFTIKAFNGEQVVVTVTRGKVSVSGASKKVLAVLTPDKQAVLSVNEESAAQNAVNSTVNMNWVKQDMQFNDQPFGQMAEKLNRRYNVEVSFSNDSLKSFPITGRFKGTETLEQVLKIISETTSTTYQVNGNHIMISGR